MNVRQMIAEIGDANAAELVTVIIAILMTVIGIVLVWPAI